MCNDIAESQKRKVFIQEYQALSNPIIISDTIILNVSVAWIERKWMYPRNYNETFPIEGFQLIILTKNEIKEGYNQRWTIGIDADRYIRLCGKKCLITDFDSLPMNEKETWKVQAGWKLNPEAEKKIIGEFTLIKKQ